MNDEHDFREHAGFWIRLGAVLLDGLIIHIPIAIIFFLITGDINTEWMDTWVYTLLNEAYLTIVPVLWGGYVIGKRICGIRIKRIDGKKLTLLTMILREVIGLYLLSMVTFGISMIVSAIMVGAGKQKRGLHDLIAGTYVARNNY
ncbi:RDD family protein [Bacillus mesophilum]|uniref:RDD family protein n=1 Tax=Bacillus mesophilum TaxID=1071718 RepID=A0A7V7RID6_9BACI|nr:RDD family protein [Bacillus mesophilum]KAB2329858.1 RDD family protein [Bacillus mesophilum]